MLPHIDYCSEVWSSTSHLCLKKIANIYSCSVQMLNRMNIDYCKLNTRLEKNMIKMIFKIVGKISPVYLQKRLKLSSEIHSRATRSALSNKIFIKRINTKLEAKLWLQKQQVYGIYGLTSMECQLLFNVDVFFQQRPEHHSYMLKEFYSFIL